MQILRADTQVIVQVGPIVAVGDGFTPVTTLSLSAADEAEVLKHEATAVTPANAYTFTPITAADGYYNLTIPAAALDTEGTFTFLVNDDSLCLPFRSDYMVVNANHYDSLYKQAATAYLQVDAIKVGGTTQTAVDIGAAVQKPKKNTALSDIPIYLVSSTDHVTPLTSAASPVVEISLDGAAFGAGGGTFTEIGAGLYQYDASTADMNGDVVVIKVTATGADPALLAISTVV